MAKRPGLDTRDLPAYGIHEVASYLGVPASTIRVWSLGQHYSTRRQGLKRSPPLFSIAERKPPTLSFWNLVELYILASMRRQHGVPLQSVRKALRYVEKQLDIERPLIRQVFLTDGKRLFIERYAQLVDVSNSGQWQIFFDSSLRRIQVDPNGLATRLFPWLLRPDEPHVVEIDPTRAFGRLALMGTGISTASLAERFRAGESIKSLANDYRLTQEQVEAALRWEHRGAAA